MILMYSAWVSGETLGCLARVNHRDERDSRAMVTVILLSCEMIG